MARPIQQVRIYAVQNRRGDERLRLPYIVRWSIDGRQRSRSFRTKAEAERFRVELLKAAQVGDRFDLDAGEPASWSLPLADLGVHQWVRRWLAEQWPEWQPRTRASAVEALARFTWLAVKPKPQVPRTGASQRATGALDGGASRRCSTSADRTARRSRRTPRGHRSVGWHTSR